METRICAKVISLADASSRRVQIAKQLSETRLDWSFFEAHTAPSPDLNVNFSALRRINGRQLTAGELGCYSSHWSLWIEHSLRKEGEILLIFEDDAIIDPLFFLDLDKIVELGNRYGLLRFGAHLTAPADDVEILGRRRVVRFKERIHSTLSYVISVSTARMLAKKLSTINRPIDVEYDRFWAHGVNIFCVYPFPVIESYADSQIGSRELLPLPWLDFLGWKALNGIEKIRRVYANISLTGA